MRSSSKLELDKLKEAQALREIEEKPIEVQTIKSPRRSIVKTTGRKRSVSGGKAER
jgi:hypothetical protein